MLHAEELGTIISMHLDFCIYEDIFLGNEDKNLRKRLIYVKILFFLLMTSKKAIKFGYDRVLVQ